MINQKIPMTVHGSELLREELQHLKTKERPDIIAAIAEARAHGDLKENAEYHAARERQSFAEGRIAEIESKMSNAYVIDISKLQNTGRVVFGVTVKIINANTDEEAQYQIVGDDEADIKIGKISVNSPIARALIGKEEGDVAVVNTPSGDIEYEVDQVLYA